MSPIRCCIGSLNTSCVFTMGHLRCAEILLTRFWPLTLDVSAVIHPRPLQQLGLRLLNLQDWSKSAHKRTMGNNCCLGRDKEVWLMSFVGLAVSKRQVISLNDPDELDGPVFKSTHPPIQSLPILSIASGIIRLAIAQGEREWAQGVIITCFAHLCTC